MKNVKSTIYTAIASLLSSIEVDAVPITYFVDYFGEQEKGIYLESYQAEDESTKHYFSSLVTIVLVCFSKSVSTTTGISEEVLDLLKASVNSTITLADGWQATYTEIPLVNTDTIQVAGVTEHRDYIRLRMKIDVKS